MCSLTAIKCNKACKELYDRLKAKGKNGKLALAAVGNKLIKQCVAVAKAELPYTGITVEATRRGIFNFY